MARPLRIEFCGALYHVTSRGDHLEAVYCDSADRQAWLEKMGLVRERFNFLVHAYCEMTNHYHLLVETVEGNLSQGMRQLNSIYTQRHNRRHDLAGHLFQGRYKAILVQKESHLLELPRYLVLNPVRAGMVDKPEHWKWSSHLAMLGHVECPSWLSTDWLLSQFSATRKVASRRYQEFVIQGQNEKSPLRDVRNQLILGDDEFIARFQDASSTNELKDVSKAHRRALALSLEQYAHMYADPKEAMARAYHSTAFTMEQIGNHFGVSVRTVSRALQLFEGRRPRGRS